MTSLMRLEREEVVMKKKFIMMFTALCAAAMLLPAAGCSQVGRTIRADAPPGASATDRAMTAKAPLLNTESGTLRAGAAKVDMTPADLAGLTNQWEQPFVGVHDRIYVRALVLSDGTTTAGIVTTDWIEFADTTELRKRIARGVGIPADHLMITATHNHGAPKPNFAAVVPAGAKAAQAYTLSVYERIVDALKQAKASLQPARMGIGSGRAYVNVNWDEYDATGWHMGVSPNRPSDKTVWVVKFETPSGNPIAVLFNYGVHSMVGGRGTTQVTGDLAGAAERYVETHYKDEAVALLTTSTLGDQTSLFSGQGQSSQEAVPAFQAIDAQGLMLGAEVVRVAIRIHEMTATARLKAEERVISCPNRASPPQPAGGGYTPPQPSFLPIHLGLILVNQIAFTSVSGEVVTKIYWDMKKASPLSDTIMISLSNGRVGYIPDDAAYDTPLSAVKDTPLERGCAEKGIVSNLAEMIEQNL